MFNDTPSPEDQEEMLDRSRAREARAADRRQYLEDHADEINEERAERRREGNEW